MPRKNKTSILAMLGAVVFIIFILKVQGVYYLNDIEIVYDQKPAFPFINKTINIHITKGAAFYFISYGHFLDFLSQMELEKINNGVDLKQLRLALNNAIVNMEKAMEQYHHFKKLAESTKYDQKVLERLAKFDYSSFQEKHKLNESIFAKVTCYLSNGEIREMYTRVFLDTEKILDKANSIKKLLDSNKTPDKQELMNLNQAYVQSLLFGQYAANVFQEIKEGTKE